MPKLALEVPSTYDNITRPVTIGIVKDLMERLNIPKDVDISFPGESDTVAHVNSVLNNRNRSPVFTFGGKVVIEYEERYLEDYVLLNNGRVGDEHYFFIDPKLGVGIKPTYGRVESVIVMKYSSNSKTDMKRWTDLLRRHSVEGRFTNLHEVIYHYVVPDVFYAILKEIYNKKEKLGGNGETFEEWLVTHYNEKLDYISNANASSILPVIAEKQINIEGWFDFFAEIERSTKEQVGDNWEQTVTYTFRYDKVLNLVMEYPILIHNQLLDMKYIPNNKIYDLEALDKEASYSRTAINSFSTINYEHDMRYLGVIIPEYDDWKPSITNQKSFIIFTALIGVELDDPHQIINLRELGNFQLNESVLQHIKNNRTSVVKYLMDAYKFSFYIGKNQQPDDYIYIDADLNVRSNHPLDFKNIHHLRLNIQYDLRVLKPNAVETLRNNPDITLKTIDFIDKMTGSSISAAGNKLTQPTHTAKNTKINLKNNTVPNATGLTDYIKVIGNKLVTKDSLNEVMSRINTNVNLSDVGQGRGLKTVMQAGIVVKIG